MLEAADLNDNTILEQTKQETDAKGHIRFKITLPDGHLLTSDWFSVEQKTTQLLIKWTESVKGQVQAREKDKQEELNALLRRQKADKDQEGQAQQAAEMGIIVPTGTLQGTAQVDASAARTMSINPSLQTSGRVATIPSPAGVLDPVKMAKQELVSAMQEVQSLRPSLADAERRVAQWKAVLTALAGIELPRESSVIAMSTKLD